MDIQNCYKVLGLESGADITIVKAAHRDLIRQYHPDKFAQDIEARLAAEEASKEINVAFGELKTYLAKEGAIKLTREVFTTPVRESAPHAWTQARAAKQERTFSRRMAETRKPGLWERVGRFSSLIHFVVLISMVGFVASKIDFEKSGESLKGFSVTKLMKSH